MDANGNKNFISEFAALIRAKGARAVVPALVIVLVIAAAGPAAAWFSHRRNVAAVAQLDSPMAIYINAAHMEDIEYLDISGIDMERKDPGGSRYNYQDFVFTVRGEDIAAFNLQLSYTTNNQFAFEIYNAVESLSPSSGSVAYTATDNTVYYYSINGPVIAMDYLNKQDGQMLGKTDDSYYSDTYEDTDRVDQYAVPVYSQSHSTVDSEYLNAGEFCNYFILRVKWSPLKTNDKETDIIYIAAKAA